MSATAIKVLETKARGLGAARRGLLRDEPDDICTERATAALEECEAILGDAAQNCRDLPRLTPIREAAGLA